jgi:hypothetical protein
MPYHSNPIDDHGFLSATKVVHFPKEPTMGYIRTPNSLNPYPPSVGVQEGDTPEDDCLPSNSSSFPNKWLSSMWSRFQKTPNIVFPAQGFNNIANITGYDSGFTRDTNIKSWAMEFWVHPNGIHDPLKWSTSDASNKYTLLQLGSLISDIDTDNYPYTLGSDALNVSLYFYDNAYPLIYWSMKTGDPDGTDADDYKFEYLFDSSKILQLNGWNHIVLEWHYGGIEPDPAAGWNAYYEGYDPTCRVWVNGFEAVRGLKQWPTVVPGADTDTVTDSPSYIGGNIVASGTTHKDCEGLPRVEVGYMGARCQQHDSGKVNGWQSTGSLITSESGRDFNDQGVLTSTEWIDYNFKGYLTEFRIWKNKRFTRSGYSNRNFTSPSNIPASYISQRLIGNEDGLVAYYPMNEGRGKFLYDKTVHTNLPAMLLVTEKTNDAYPEDDNVDAINNVRWDTPPEGLKFEEANENKAVFIKQDKVQVGLEIDETNKIYASDTVTFGEHYDSITESGATNFSFLDSKEQRLAPKIGDYLLLKWNVDPSCLKRDMLQTMTNIVTVSLPYYREPYPIVLDLLHEENTDVPPPTEPLDPDDPKPSNEPWMSIYELEWGYLKDVDFTDGVKFTFDSSNGGNYDYYRGFGSYQYDDATNEVFENTFMPNAITANLTMEDFEKTDYYFLLYLTYGNNRRKTYHSRNARSFVLNTRYRDQQTSSLWAIVNEASSPPIEKTQDQIKRELDTNILDVAFTGDAQAASPHTLTVTIPNDDSSNRILSSVKHARLEIYNKYSVLKKTGQPVTLKPKIAFGPTPYGELAFFKEI